LDQINALRVFRAVAENGSFVQASKVLGISASAVTKNIADLELSLKVRLVQRSTRSFGLTEAGKGYHVRISKLLDDLSEANAALTQHSEQLSGSIRMTASSLMSHVVLPRMVAEFLRLNPDVSIELDAEDRFSDLVREGYDLALRGSSGLRDSSLIARRLAGMHQIPVASPSYLLARGTPNDPQALTEHDCIRFDTGPTSDQWPLTSGTRQVSLKIDGRFTTTSGLALRDAAINGLGVAMIPSMMVVNDLKAKRLVRLVPDWVGSPSAIYAVYPSRRMVSRTLSSLVEFLATAFAAASLDDEASQ